jgi:signal peptidase I
VTQERHPEPWAFREYAEAVLAAVLFALFAKAFVFEAFEIPTASMEPTLLTGDHVVVNKFVYGPHRGPWARLLPYRDVAPGQVIVFRFPEDPRTDFIKRAVARAGDAVAIEGRRLLVNGREAIDPHAVYAAGERPREFGPVTVAPEATFALGDNRDDSRDSRAWGSVPDALLKGRAVFVYWSYDGRVAARPFTGRGAGLRKAVDTALHFFQRTRWHRTGRLVR